MDYIYHCDIEICLNILVLANQEDSIILNKNSVDRGLFLSTAYRTISTSETKRGTHSSEIIEIPPTNLRHNTYDYTKLDRDGIVYIGAYVKENDIIVGKVCYENDVATKDCSIACKLSESGYVENVCVTLNASGYKHIKIKLRSLRIPEIGDKFSSYEAQKGTAGMIYRQEDMPFNKDGISPDIIINAQALGSAREIVIFS